VSAAVDRPGAPLVLDAPTLAEAFGIPLAARKPHPTGPQAEALALAAQGLTYRQIGRRLFLTEVSVRKRMVRAFRALGIHSKAAAVRAGVESGILDPTGSTR